MRSIERKLLNMSDLATITFRARIWLLVMPGVVNVRHTLPSVLGFLLVLVIGSSPAAAQSFYRAAQIPLADPTAPAGMDHGSRYHPQFEGPAPSVTSATTAARRPKALTGLYGSLAAVQILDVMSTRAALSNGGVELNPAMRGSIGRQLGVKAAMTLGTVAVAERLWKKNKVAAIATVLAANGALAVISANNLRNARTGR